MASTLGKWQIVSFVSRGIAMALGLFQSFIILRILSVAEWGLAQQAVAIGASLGIYQHLGLAGASTREISAAKDKGDIFKIFFTTALVRYLITIPLSVGLFLLAPKIAQAYKVFELANLLKLYSFVILFQGVQSVLNSVISGTQRFKELFIYQAAIAVLSVILHIPLVYYYRVNGFFYALVLFSLLSSISLFIVSFYSYRGRLVFPSKQDFIKIFKELFSLGMSIYIVKVIVTNWEKLGANLLGFTQNAETIAIYAFALLYAKKLMHISDAVTDVNLPVFSERFANDIKLFKESFVRNFNKIFALVLFSAFSAIFWSYELVTFLIGDNKYNASLPYILPLVFSFVFFSLLDIVKSSVIVPAKMKVEMIISFTLLLVGTGIFFVIANTKLNPLQAMSYAMAFGAAISFAYTVLVSQRKFKFKFFTHDHFLLLLQALFISVALQDAIFIVKLFGYGILASLYIWCLIIAKFFGLRDIKDAIYNVFLMIKNFVLKKK